MPSAPPEASVGTNHVPDTIEPFNDKRVTEVLLIP